MERDRPLGGFWERRRWVGSEQCKKRLEWIRKDDFVVLP